IGDWALYADDPVKPGCEREEARPVLIDVNGLIQVSMQVDVLNDPDVLVQPGVTGRLVDKRCRAIKHQDQSSEVRGQSNWRRLSQGQCPTDRDHEESDPHVENDGKCRGESELTEMRCVRLAHAQTP